MPQARTYFCSVDDIAASCCSCSAWYRRRINSSCSLASASPSIEGPAARLEASSLVRACFAVGRTLRGGAAALALIADRAPSSSCWVRASWARFHCCSCFAACRTRCCRRAVSRPAAPAAARLARGPPSAANSASSTLFAASLCRSRALSNATRSCTYCRCLCCIFSCAAMNTGGKDVSKPASSQF